MQLNNNSGSQVEYSFDSLIQNFAIRGKELVGLCPFHNDHSPSFSGNLETGLWRCFAGCGAGNWSQFLERIGECGSIKKTKAKKVETSAKFKREATYFYKDLVGKTVLKIIRYRNLLNGKKSFIQYTFDGNAWIPKGFSGELAPYRYDEWSNAKFIILVEGEKVADYLQALGVPATTTPGGACNWKSIFAKFFFEKTVVILPDHDSPGLVYAQSALEDIKKFAKKVKIVELPGLHEKEDAFDWFEKRGGSRPLLKQILYKELSYEK